MASKFVSLESEDITYRALHSRGVKVGEPLLFNLDDVIAVVDEGPHGVEVLFRGDSHELYVGFEDYRSKSSWLIRTFFNPSQ